MVDIHFVPHYRPSRLPITIGLVVILAGAAGLAVWPLGNLAGLAFFTTDPAGQSFWQALTRAALEAASVLGACIGAMLCYYGWKEIRTEKRRRRYRR